MSNQAHNDFAEHQQNTEDITYTDAKEGSDIVVNDDIQIEDASYSRDGMDLIIEYGGETMHVHDYFSVPNPPDLVTSDGKALSSKIVNAFLEGSNQFADAGQSLSDVSPVGQVSEISGKATITRPNGSVEPLSPGTKVFQGDIIETSANGAVNIEFVDETNFAVSENARLAIDEYVYDTSTQSGTSNFSLLKGVFVYTSGLIGRDDPDDVAIDTPIGSIGIRGTIIAGDLTSGKITVVEGAIVLRDFTGNEVTLAQQFETARFSTQTLNSKIAYEGVISASEFSDTFSPLSDVAPGLFSSIEDAKAAEEAEQEAEEEQPEEVIEEGQDTEATDEEAFLMDQNGLLQDMGQQILLKNSIEEILDKKLDFNQEQEGERESVSFEAFDDIQIFFNPDEQRNNSDDDDFQLTALIGDLNSQDNQNWYYNGPSGFAITDSNNNYVEFADGLSFNITIASNSERNTIQLGDGGGGQNVVNIQNGADQTTVYGGNGSDKINILEADIQISGGGGDDEFVFFLSAFSDFVSAPNSFIDGGAGLKDTIFLDTTVSGSIDLSNIDQMIQNIEILNMDNGDALAPGVGEQTIILTADSVFNMTDGNNTLFIDMDNNDTVDMSDASFSGFTVTANGFTDGDGQVYDVWTDGTTTLYIDTEGNTL